MIRYIFNKFLKRIVIKMNKAEIFIILESIVLIDFFAKIYV